VIDRKPFFCVGEGTGEGGKKRSGQNRQCELQGRRIPLRPGRVEPLFAKRRIGKGGEISQRKKKSRYRKQTRKKKRMKGRTIYFFLLEQKKTKWRKKNLWNGQTESKTR